MGGRIIRAFLATVAFVVLAIAALVWFGQRSLIYFPSSDVPAPAAAGLGAAEPVDLITADGLTLGAWFVPPCGEPSGYTVIVFNGNAGHRGHRAVLADRLTGAGFAVLLVDYRGYGGNPGLPYETGIMRDARAALAYLRAERPDVDERRLVFFGESLGAAVAIRLAVEFAPAGLVLRSPFSSLGAMAQEHFRVGGWGQWLLRDRYDSIRWVQQVRSPLLMIVGDRDAIVPMEDSEILFARAHEPKTLVTVRGADHNDEALVDGPELVTAVVEWLRRSH